MANINIALEHIFSVEGTAYTDAKDDHGGPTKFGITIKTAAQYFRRPVSVSEMKTMAQSVAALIYKETYWDQLRLDEISSDQIAAAILDVDVNCGQLSAIHLVESALNTLGYATPKTKVWTNIIQTLNTVKPDAFIAAFHDAVVSNYKTIAALDPTQSIYLAGWINRANTLLFLTGEAA